MNDIDDIGTAIVIILRFFAFVIGVVLLATGLADFGSLGSSNLVLAFSAGPNAIIKIVVGVILMILAIAPSAIGVIIQWIVKT